MLARPCLRSMLFVHFRLGVVSSICSRSRVVTHLLLVFPPMPEHTLILERCLESKAFCNPVQEQKPLVELSVDAYKEKVLLYETELPGLEKKNVFVAIGVQDHVSFRDLRSH